MDLIQAYAPEVFVKYMKRDPLNAQLLAIAIALAVVLLTLVILRFIHGKSAAGKYILMVGLEDAGKTLLFTQLVYGKQVMSFTSMKHNESLIKVTLDGTAGSKSSRQASIADLPGFSRLRAQFWDQFRSRARAVIFVLDASTLSANLREVADFLYTVLSDETVTKSRLPVLIACNKQDELKAKTSNAIRGQLERELNAIRNTRAAALGSTDENSEANSKTTLGNPSKDFKFDDLKTPVAFLGCSAVSEDPSVQNFVGIKKWIYRSL